MPFCPGRAGSKTCHVTELVTFDGTEGLLVGVQSLAVPVKDFGEVLMLMDMVGWRRPAAWVVDLSTQCWN